MSQTNQGYNLSKQGEFLVYERQFSPPYIYSGLYKEQDPQFCKDFDLDKLLPQIERNLRDNRRFKVEVRIDALHESSDRKTLLNIARLKAQNVPVSPELEDYIKNKRQMRAARQFS